MAPWQQHVIDQILTDTRLMADNAQDAIMFGNTKPKDLWLADYRKYLNNLYSEANSLTHSVGTAVKFASVSNEYQELRHDLGYGPLSSPSMFFIRPAQEFGGRIMMKVNGSKLAITACALMLAIPLIAADGPATNTDKTMTTTAAKRTRLETRNPLWDDHEGRSRSEPCGGPDFGRSTLRYGRHREDPDQVWRSGYHLQRSDTGYEQCRLGNIHARAPRRRGEVDPDQRIARVDRKVPRDETP